MNLTPYQIAEKADHLNGITNIKLINKLFRDQDDSHLWPIRNAFNVTERAIRKARKFRRNCPVDPGLEYALLLYQITSDIVNNY